MLLETHSEAPLPALVMRQIKRSSYEKQPKTEISTDWRRNL